MSLLLSEGLSGISMLFGSTSVANSYVCLGFGLPLESVEDLAGNWINLFPASQRNLVLWVRLLLLDYLENSEMMHISMKNPDDPVVIYRQTM